MEEMLFVLLRMAALSVRLVLAIKSGNEEKVESIYRKMEVLHDQAHQLGKEEGK